jgi:nicotinamide-nucleotide amidase
MVVYSNEAKIYQLGISEELIDQHGAVSSQVATAMAVGIREQTRSSLGLAITGIAGPEGGTPEKPVGLVYTALAWDNGTDVVKNLFLGNREIIKYQSTQKSLDMVRRHLLKNPKSKEN